MTPQLSPVAVADRRRAGVYKRAGWVREAAILLFFFFFLEAFGECVSASLISDRPVRLDVHWRAKRLRVLVCFRARAGLLLQGKDACRRRLSVVCCLDLFASSPESSVVVSMAASSASSLAVKKISGSSLYVSKPTWWLESRYFFLLLLLLLPRLVCQAEESARSLGFSLFLFGFLLSSQVSFFLC